MARSLQDEMNSTIAELLSLPAYLRPKAKSLGDYSPEILKMTLDILSKRQTEIKEVYDWLTQDHQCSGSGFAHAPHGKCTGYAYDRT